MNARMIGLLAVGLFALAGCRDTAQGDYVALDGKIFVFNYRVAMATYLVNLKALRKPTDGMVAVAQFENPAGGPPLEIREKLWPQNERTTLNSPPVFCVVKDRPYRVEISIRDSAGNAVQKLETTVTSSEDQTILPDQPLVMGPEYTPNDGRAKAPGVKPDVCPAP